jgi:homoaconitase/3-isopropylmalate dehydratase large subunit
MGRPGKGVMSKDVALALIGAIGSGGAFIYSIQLCEMESKLQV